MEEDHSQADNHAYEEEDETVSSSEEEDEDSMKYINASHIDVRGNDDLILMTNYNIVQEISHPFYYNILLCHYNIFILK